MTMQSEAPERLNEADAEVKRIIRTGTVWTAAAIIASAISMGSMLSSGWRPSALPAPDTEMFWIGAFVALVGVAALVWAGCPTLGATVAAAARQKVLCIRGGIVLYLAGTVVATLAVLVSPAS